MKRSVDGKLQAVWNKQKQSYLATDFIKQSLDRLFVVKNATRWNSYYDALVRVKEFIDQKSDDLKRVFEHLKLPVLTKKEEEYIAEFVLVAQPLSEALDSLQNESTMSIGSLLPTIKLLLQKFDAQSRNIKIVHCQPLVANLRESVTRRFQHMFTDQGLRLAAMSDPSIKLQYWVDDDEKEADIQLLKQEIRMKRLVSSR